MANNNKTFRRRKRAQLQQRCLTPVTLQCQQLSHEGRGLSWGPDLAQNTTPNGTSCAPLNDTQDSRQDSTKDKRQGKIQFIFNALPGETWHCRFIAKHAKYDTFHAFKLASAAHADRVEPVCAHYLLCGGCELQHLKHTAQIQHKQALFQELLQQHTGQLPTEILPPLTASTQHYRHKARLGVKYLADKDEVIIGFRKRHAPRHITRIQHCSILAQPLADQLPQLQMLLQQLQAKAHIPQLEIAIGEAVEPPHAPLVMMVLRHLKPLALHDLLLLQQSSKLHGWQWLLRPNPPQTTCSLAQAISQARIQTTEQLEGAHVILKNNSSTQTVGNNAIQTKTEMASASTTATATATTTTTKKIPQLSYSLPAHQLRIFFSPEHFTQINPAINTRMMDQALQLLALQPHEHALDLFCGIGNFSLAMARYCQQVTAVEVAASSIAQAKRNAQHNKLQNAEFICSDLSQPLQPAPWWQRRYHKLLLDPPRCGADAMIPYIATWRPERIVYIACHMHTLARDCAKIMDLGYHLQSGGIMDMFSHTQHCESMLLLVRKS